MGKLGQMTYRVAKVEMRKHGMSIQTFLGYSDLQKSSNVYH